MIDDREPPHISELLAEKCSVPIIFQRMDEGDFCSSDGKILIQRKEVNDLCMSIIDGRLFGKDGKEGQIQRMTQNADKCYLLVHGYLENSTVKIHPHAVIGALCKIASQFNVQILWVNDEDSMVYAILKVFEWEGKLELLKPKRKKPVEVHEPDFFAEEQKL